MWSLTFMCLCLIELIATHTDRLAVCVCVWERVNSFPLLTPYTFWSLCKRLIYRKIYFKQSQSWLFSIVRMHFDFLLCFTFRVKYNGFQTWWKWIVIHQLLVQNQFKTRHLYQVHMYISYVLIILDTIANICLCHTATQLISCFQDNWNTLILKIFSLHTAILLWILRMCNSQKRWGGSKMVHSLFCWLCVLSLCVENKLQLFVYGAFGEGRQSEKWMKQIS